MARRVSLAIKLQWCFSNNLLINDYDVNINYSNSCLKGLFLKYIIQCVIVLHSQHYDHRM